MPEKIKDYYNNVAEIYDKRCKQDEYYLNTNFHALQDRYWIRNKDILDIGCGTGRFTKLLAGVSPFVTGIDFSLEMLKIAQKDNRYKAYLMDMCELDFPRNKFDIVTAIGSLEYQKRLTLVFSEVYRVLRPGGIFYFNFHLKHFHIQLFRFFKSKTRDWEYNLHTKKSIKRLLNQTGFEIEHQVPVYFLPARYNTYQRDENLRHTPIIKNFSAMLIVGARKCK